MYQVQDGNNENDATENRQQDETAKMKLRHYVPFIVYINIADAELCGWLLYLVDDFVHRLNHLIWDLIDLFRFLIFFPTTLTVTLENHRAPHELVVPIRRRPFFEDAAVGLRAENLVNPVARWGQTWWSIKTVS